MDLFGIGAMELAIVLLAAVIVLGPARMVEMASRMGTYWREAQRLLRETADAATLNLDAPPPTRSAPAEPAEESVARSDTDGSTQEGAERRG